ncbi:UDP-glucose:glyco protein glucosyltransferas-like protein [Lindgomyces ingoldianus]|uniref:UDP-glucose:glyco protein glucosyltransferas-like protein n=1 Tax=Lindgomyces ingoldianus TaxID=673940 RepID=A0ACB6RIH0_9PLEO|nr:UDP-glucose:glyco protein glucosyltransferas-like protein [Lindgomyces ingoldianus]KAF2478130.1 UDP-glucose:glyco protein glucosyltransferas-like protein [Lindgomyces ingoldianus]
MRAFGLPLSLRSLLVLSAFGSLRAFASPSINVALRASFNSAPYLIELLETAAEENSTAYFPILDRIAEGYFSKVTTDQELYTSFVDLLQTDGHITDPATLSSFRFALSVRSAAPRIEAHYQFYNTSVEPSLQAAQGEECRVWVAFEGKQYCSPELKESHGDIRAALSSEGRDRGAELPFDRVLGANSDAIPSILYADITSPTFAHFHKLLSKTAREGETTYRVRHKPSLSRLSSPLIVNGYGVELQLKRTDYIVIDDRPAKEGGNAATQKPLDTELHGDEEVADLKPLSASEVSNLGLNAASFVMKSENPLDTLLKLVQDFPKHSSAIVNHNASDEFVKEHTANRDQLLPSGYNILWINGVQIPNRDINPFSLLEHLRRERNLINGIRSQGLSGPETIDLLSNSAITDTQSEDEPQRYDFRDEVEGGHVIIWMNDLEKDKRYEDWPSAVTALLQRTYPGQLPSVRRDIHNAILPVDFTSNDEVFTVVETIQGMVKRGIPIRWGLVPKAKTAASEEQAKIVYHLLDTYGLSAVMNYLAASRDAKKLSAPDKAVFDAIIKSAKLRKDHEVLEYAEVLTSEEGQQRLTGSKKYLARLAADGANSPMFVNGVPIVQNDEWLQMMSQRISMDLRSIQKGVFEQIFQEDSWLPQYFLFQAAPKRNPLIIPENEKNIILVDMAEFQAKHGDIFKQMPQVKAGEGSAKGEWAHLTVVGDFDSPSGVALLSSAAQYRKDHANVELVLIHNPKADAEESNASEDLLEAWQKSGQQLSIELLLAILAQEPTFSPIRGNSTIFWKSAAPIMEAFGLQPGQGAVLINGRYVGPIPLETAFAKDDIETLLSYESKKRIEPLAKALQALELTDKISSPFDMAKISSLVSLSTVSDIPEGMFESASTLRMNVFTRWNDTHTAIIKGDNSTATFQIVVSVDPATELAQKWVPILKSLSEMDGVYLKLFLNPKQNLQELPVKRFYRYLLDSKPKFNEDGGVDDLEAHFSGIPKEALLNLGMDVPPSWLVAPEDSIHDLDNIKLSSLSNGVNIDAIYGLESILIEGHSRDITNSGQPPRGAELVLSTEKNPHFADTIIMANLGYFQFKANPGFFKIQLKSGRSQEIFNIDSAGPKGWAPQPGDETSEIVLMSFQGTTLFPRLSRKPGQEAADVLSSDDSLASELVEKGTRRVNKWLDKIGLSSLKPENVLAKGGSGVQADINIFSVASGHLYERMLNIMMLSVMKHTNHTVKFWFIEQFLSPSFKSFVPSMAKEYGFDYEMVTYKWPHWLRGQTEKQREIWGYKILFLDVLFPLDLDKVIFVDADQIVRTDMYELVTHDLKGAPYGFTPMCDSRAEMEGFRFWKQGYWKNFLRGLPYHISALYVVDLKRFRQIAAGDRLRQQYHSLSADPASLSNLDQDLPNNMQFNLPIHSLPQEWLWCETWCSDESLKDAKTIDLCNNPQTKEPKLDRARRQVPEWTTYDDEIAALAKRTKEGVRNGGDEGGNESMMEKEDKGKKDARRIRDEL